MNTNTTEFWATIGTVGTATIAGIVAIGKKLIGSKTTPVAPKPKPEYITRADLQKSVTAGYLALNDKFDARTCELANQLGASHRELAAQIQDLAATVRTFSDRTEQRLSNLEAMVARLDERTTTSSARKRR